MNHRTPHPPLPSTGEELKQLRNDGEIRIARWKLAQRIGVPASVIQRVEEGRSAMPSGFPEKVRDALFEMLEERRQVLLAMGARSERSASP